MEVRALALVHGRGEETGMNKTEKLLAIALVVCFTTVAFAQTYMAGVRRGVLEAGDILIGRNLRRGR